MNEEQLNRWANTLTKLDAPFWLINKAIHRMRAGTDKYGVYDPSKDHRNLLIEIEKELLDAVNYALMAEDESVLLPDLIKMVEKVRTLRP